MSLVPFTRSGRVPGVSHVHRTRNPFTGRWIVVNGPTYRRIIEYPEIIGLPNGALVVDPDTLTMVVTRIIDPSTGLEEDRLAEVDFGEDARIHFLAALGGGPLNWDLLMEDADLWFAEWGVQVQIGPYTARRDRGITEGPEVQRPGDAILANDPVVLPFTNVMMNPGDDDLCVSRFLSAYQCKEAICPKPTIHDLYKYCVNQRRYIEVFDVWGGMYMSHDPPNGTASSPFVMRAVVYRGHLYPMYMNAKNPEFVTRVVGTYIDRADFIKELKQRNIGWFQVNDRFLVGKNSYMRMGIYEQVVQLPDGTFGRPLPPKMLNKNMLDICAMIPKYTWNTDVLRSIKWRLMGLYKSGSPRLTHDADTSLFIGIDMTKCYYNVLRRLCISGRMPVPDPFETIWRDPASATDSGSPLNRWTLVLTNYAPAAYGLRTNLMLHSTFALLRESGVTDLEIELVLDMPYKSFPLAFSKAILDIKEDDKQSQKDIAQLVGLCGKVSEQVMTCMGAEGMSENEISHYCTEYDFAFPGPHSSYLIRNRPGYFPTNQYHIAQAVVLFANEQVIRMMTRFNCLPVRIHTDGLVYLRHDLVWAGWRSPATVLRRAMELSFYPWHDEPVKVTPPHTPMPVRVTSSRVPTESKFPLNMTFQGPPGTGKTTRALNEDHDLVVSFSNRNVRRLAAHTKAPCMTMHKAFKMIPSLDRQPDFSTVAGKCVVVDEAQALSRKMWSFMMHAYQNHGTRFIFAMDPRQLPPVNETPVPHEHAFYGNITVLTKDYRNDYMLCSIRELAWSGGFVPRVTGPLEGIMTFINIAYSNPEVDIVNEVLSLHFGRRFGDSGPYIVDRPDPAKGLFMSMIFERYDNVMTNLDSGMFTEMSVEYLEKHFTWAWCTTVHKRIGSESREPITIWGCVDGSRMLTDRNVLYTAITRAFSYDQLIFRGDMIADADLYYHERPKDGQMM